MDDQIRCFIAVELPAGILDEIETYLARLKKIAPEIRWVRAGSIHITLKFLGEQPEVKVKEVAKKLEGAKGLVQPFTLTVNGAGCFPNHRQPRVFWLGLEQDKSNPLFQLHAWVEDRLALVGFEKEKRRFSPHLTLGRVKQSGDYTRVFNFLDENPLRSESFLIKEISLMQSELRPSGALYTAIKTVAF